MKTLRNDYVFEDAFTTAASSCYGVMSLRDRLVSAEHPTAFKQLLYITTCDALQMAAGQYSERPDVSTECLEAFLVCLKDTLEEAVTDCTLSGKTFDDRRKLDDRLFTRLQSAESHGSASTKVMRDFIVEAHTQQRSLVECCKRTTMPTLNMLYSFDGTLDDFAKDEYGRAIVPITTTSDASIKPATLSQRLSQCFGEWHNRMQHHMKLSEQSQDHYNPALKQAHFQSAASAARRAQKNLESLRDLVTKVEEWDFVAMQLKFACEDSGFNLHVLKTEGFDDDTRLKTLKYIHTFFAAASKILATAELPETAVIQSDSSITAEHGESKGPS